MKESRISSRSGNSYFEIDGRTLPACAYITYFEERNEYKTFAQSGCRLYSVSISTASQPINAVSGFMPFERGVFDDKQQPDFSAVDASIQMVLDACPDAYIFPRIYVCMPKWWIDENPSETIMTQRGMRRESLYSDAFRKDAGEMLRRLIAHLHSSAFSDRILGYQISGGNTQEWFHLDLNGGHDKTALPYFRKYLAHHHPEIPLPDALPTLDEWYAAGRIADESLRLFLEFASVEVAETISHLCRIAKETVDYRRIIGVFYGYCMEVSSPLWGTHALRRLLDSPHIDFFSSPNSYVNGRSLGIDWGDMMPVDSIRLHGKMCFLECDIRTFLTRSPESSRKGSDPDLYYTDAVWTGPETEQLSVWAVRKSLARQLTHCHGLWWFDMFGHWFAVDSLMHEMRASFNLYRDVLAQSKSAFPTEVAVFVDETMYTRLGRQSSCINMLFELRTALGSCGCPYHLYLIEDFERIDLSRYKAVVFAIPDSSDRLIRAQQSLSALRIPYLHLTEPDCFPSAQQLGCFFESCGAWRYTDSGDVLYAGNGFLAVHAASAGEKRLKLPGKMRLKRCIDGPEIYEGDALTLTMRRHETLLFRCI